MRRNTGATDAVPVTKSREASKNTLKEGTHTESCAHIATLIATTTIGHRKAGFDSESTSKANTLKSHTRSHTSMNTSLHNLFIMAVTVPFKMIDATET